MKKLLAILTMLMIFISSFAQTPKVVTEKHKKDGYWKYTVNMEVGGSVKQSDYVNTLELQFSYKRHFDGYNNEGRMYFLNRGWDNCIEEINGKKTIILQLLVDGDTLTFIPDYWSIDHWTTNGVMSDRPDRYFNSSFYTIYDVDIEKLLNAQSSIDVIKFGIYENFGWYLSGKNLDEIDYLMNYQANDPKFPQN